jgi:hypothetical protein
MPGLEQQHFLILRLTLIMARQEHVHIITAGENIHKVYSAAIRDLADISHTFVFADTEIYTNSARDDEKTQAQTTAVRDAVTEVKSISASLKIPCPLIYVTPPAFASACDTVQKIRREHPDAKYSFDLSAGSKDLGIALFSISLWLEGDAYYAFTDRKGDGGPAKLAVPKVPARDVWANPNYMKILSVLGSTPNVKEAKPRVLPRHYLFTQLESFYVPVKKKGVKIANNKAGKTDLYTGKKAVIPILSQGTFTDILSIMKELDLIREDSGQGNNRKEKYYRITPGGELALQLVGIKTQKP